MRYLTHFSDHKVAEKFSTILAAKDIENEIRESEQQGGEVWVIDEDRLAESNRLLATFQSNPQAAEFQNIKVEKKEVPTPRSIDVRTEVFNNTQVGTIPVVTLFMILASVMLFMFDGSRQYFMISNYPGLSLPEIKSGEVWRLLTPIFLHGGFLHILFNMIWLYQLGGQIEILSGSRMMIFLTIGIGFISNIAQLLWAGPNFVGMSGVVYGLLGFIWARQKWGIGVPRYALQDQTMGFMVLWLVICAIGIIPNVANGTHIAGILSGIAFGFLTSGHLKRLWRKKNFSRKLD